MHENHRLSDLRNRDRQAARGARSGGGVGPGVAQFSGWALSLPARPPARGIHTLAGPSSLQPSSSTGWQMHGCQVVRKTRFTWRESFVRLEDVEESLEDTVLDGKDFRYPRLLTAAEREAAQKTR